MGNKDRQPPTEDKLHFEPLPSLASLSEPPTIVDTHTHLESTFGAYRAAFPAGEFVDLPGFIKGFYGAESKHPGVKTLIDVWCEPPILKSWKEIADSALTEDLRAEKWGGLDYWFVMGVHPYVVPCVSVSISFQSDAS